MLKCNILLMQVIKARVRESDNYKCLILLVSTLTFGQTPVIMFLFMVDPSTSHKMLSTPTLSSSESAAAITCSGGRATPSGSIRRSRILTRRGAGGDFSLTEKERRHCNGSVRSDQVFLIWPCPGIKLMVVTTEY